MSKILDTPGWWWQWFVATTPRDRYRITGHHCLHRGAGELYGALLVESVEWCEAGSQLLPGMPEIPYVDQEPLSVPAGAVAATFTRKLDGTAIIFSPLELPWGGVEVFARTRGMQVLCDMDVRAWRSMVDEATAGGLRERIEEAARSQKATLVFELYGTRNAHAVSYDEQLELALHTVVQGRSLKPWRVVERVADQFRIPCVPVLERITSPTVEGLQERAQFLADQMEAANAPDLGRFDEEGLVLNVETPSKAAMWKFKPQSMAEYHRLSQQKIRPLTIRHEAWKLVETGQWPPGLTALADALASTYSEDAVRESTELIRREYALWMVDVYDKPGLLEGQR